MVRTKLFRLALVLTLPVLGGGSVLVGCNPPDRVPECGDGFVDVAYDEECDDGNEVLGDGCAPIFCIVEPMFECTDTTPLDGVPGTCVRLRCGDMRVTAGEACDPGMTSTAACDGDCSLPECGDGFLNMIAGEECDDDNVMPGDGCTPVCIIEPASCGNGVCDLDGEETCANCMRDCTADPMCNGCMDADMDGYYDDSCGGNDCDDTVATTHPDAMDILCNDVDDDCDAATSGSADVDMDGWRCGLDCDDSNPMIAPMLDEVCADGLDNDCDPTTPDIGDADGDGVDCMTDCDDANPLIAPGLREVCNNGLDDDCSRADLLPGETDPTRDVADIDGDGVFCNAGDCDDYDDLVRPGATELICDMRDNDCAPGTTDQPDLDRDGASSCIDTGMDCDDANALRSPLLTEICGNLIDDDCDAATPDSQDVDGDGFDCAVDCNDSDPAVFPDAVGRCGGRALFAYDFEDGPQGWTASMAASRVTSWAHGVPTAAKTFITACADASAGCWMTNLSGPYLPREYGYITSPPMDMSAAVIDPVMSFSHIYQTQIANDTTWVELSTDGGMTWNKVGAAGEGQNWYSDATTRTWFNTSGAAGAWRTASHELTGAAGNADVRVRFVFQSDAMIHRDGVGVDDVLIDNQPIDAAVNSVAITRPSCGPTGSVDVTVANLGRVVIPSYSVSLVVEGRAPVVQMVTTPLLLGGTAVINFPGIAFAMEPTSATATVTAPEDSVAGNDAQTAARACVGAFPIPFAPVATTGTTVLAGADDSLSAAIPIGFSFRFFENTYTTVTISSNGFIGFGTQTSAGCCSGGTIPAASTPNNIIAAAWTDLVVSGGSITYETRGTAGSRIFVVSYNNVSMFGGGGTVTTQIILSESGRIQIHTTSQPAGTRTFTQGVENATGTSAFFVPGRVAAAYGLTNDGVEFYTF